MTSLDHTRFGPVLAVAAALVLSLVARESAAIEVESQAPTRSQDNHPSSVNPFTISYEDCNGGNDFTFTVTDITAGQEVQVWATGTGAPCEQQIERNTNKTCQLVKNVGIVTDISASVTIASKDIAEAFDDVTSCDDSGASDAPRTMTLYFLVDPAQGDVTVFDTYEVKVDLNGPPAPTNVAASVNDETSLLVKFSAPLGTTDIAGYYVYCDSSAVDSGASQAQSYHPNDTPAVAGAGGAGGTAGQGGAATGGGSTGGGSTGGGSTGGGSTGGGSTGGSGTTTTTTTTTAGSGGAGGAASGTCQSSILTPGQVPAGLTFCGSSATSTASEVKATGLSLGVTTAVAVAAYDVVGNVGPLSELDCGQPQEVEDFFEAYRAAGGQAGGGLCNCGLVGSERSLPLGSMALLGLALAAAAARRETRTGGET